MSTSNDNEPREENTQVKFRFCRNCSNLLYPTENKDSNSLKFQCRHCNLAEEAETACVFRNDLTNAVGETAGITQDVGMDPTLPRTNKPCPKCNAEIAVFFQSQQRTADTGMSLYYVCVECGTVWQ